MSLSISKSFINLDVYQIHSILYEFGEAYKNINIIELPQIDIKSLTDDIAYITYISNNEAKLINSCEKLKAQNIESKQLVTDERLATYFYQLSVSNNKTKEYKILYTYQYFKQHKTDINQAIKNKSLVQNESYF